MSKVTKAVLAVALTVIIASFGFIGGFVSSRLVPADSFEHIGLGASESTAAARVDEVLALMNSRALVPPSDTSATAGSVQGLLSSMGDKYATYFDAEQYKSFNEVSMGSFGGIGVVVGEKGKTSYAVEVYAGTPAAKAGVKAGDVFLVIAGKRRDNWQTKQVVKLVRGDIGTKVTITFLRPSTAKGAAPDAGIEKTFTITRAQINYPNLKTEMIGKVGYLRLGQFNGNAAGDIKKGITSLTKRGATSLVLDLREDPGGLLQEAVDVSSLFIQSGVIVRVDERGKSEEVLRARNTKMTDLPLVVLIDANSASASEITGGALQDYGRATLVGVTSYGKGSVQTVRQLSNGGAVKFTIAHYLTPKSRVINGKGLTPDVIVKMDPLKQIKRSTDTQLAKALQIANSKAAGN